MRRVSSLSLEPEGLTMVSQIANPEHRFSAVFIPASKGLLFSRTCAAVSFLAARQSRYAEITSTGVITHSAVLLPVITTTGRK